MKIVIPDKIELNKEHQIQLSELPNTTVYSDCVNDETEIINRITDAELITANYIDITENIINNAPNLKYIIVPATGYDWVDTKACDRKGIKIINCPTFNSAAVAEHAIALMFSLSKRIVESHISILKGEWKPKKFVGTELIGKNVFVIGSGNIGSKITKLATTIGMNCTSANSTTSDQEIDKNLGDADFVVLSLPLNEETKGLIDERRLNIIKRTSFLTNVARGLIIDQEALFQALIEGKIAGAGLDVFPDDNTISKPREDILRFSKLPNVVTTPHIAYLSKESTLRRGEELITSIEACLKGNPINLVN